jgi:predicted TPR repeat methyltransferase
MSADPLLLSAIELHKGGRLAEAEVRYRRVLRKRPDDGDALNFLGMLRFHRGDPGAARELLHRSVQVLPDNANAWVNFGNVLLAHDDADGAKAAFVKATELAPAMPSAWFNLGVCLGRSKQSQEAASCLHKALQLEPGHAPAYEALARLLYTLGNLPEATEVYREWLAHHPDDPVARHMLAAVSGENPPPRAEDGFVTRTFDHFAATFDDNLKGLGYRAPDLLASRLGRLMPATGSLEVLDAGCGTGLCAPLLRPFARTLVGVDLSGGMVEKARERGGYDELVVAELCAFMRARSQRYDVVLSADTLCYFGALEEPLAAAHTTLRPGGWLLFTLERLDARAAEERHRLQPHGRYAHGQAYVEAAMQAAGFGELTIETGTLRRERGSDVTGLVVAARMR